MSEFDDWDQKMARAKQIRQRIEALDAERVHLWDEYCQIFPAGVVDEEDVAWATGKPALPGQGESE